MENQTPGVFDHLNLYQNWVTQIPILGSGITPRRPSVEEAESLARPRSDLDGSNGGLDCAGSVVEALADFEDGGGSAGQSLEAFHGGGPVDRTVAWP